MSYTVFALKWRPQYFDEVVGQDHVTTTLKNAIRMNRVAHAYLFSGPRGVGKTSVARIFAKSLNCMSPQEGNPCSQCENCLDIAHGRSLDVIEIDGASNRRIDDVRELSENVRFAPSRSSYKIYIIDEVHMLTKEAFNALLKTLEEPPDHAKFIFATTEPEKVIDTIVSRCQRFTFRRMDVPQTVSHLKKIIAAEHAVLPEDIVYDIARAADGSMRDAESLLDQVVSYYTADMGKEDLIALLGLIGFESVAVLIDRIMARDGNAALLTIDRMVAEGKDIYILLLNIIGYVRNIILLVYDARDLVAFSDEEYIHAKKQADALSLESWMYMMTVLLELEPKVKRHAMPRIPFEMAIIKLMHVSDLVSLKALMEQVEALPAAFPMGQTQGHVVRDVSDAGYAPVSEETAVSVVPETASAPSPDVPETEQRKTNELVTHEAGWQRVIDRLKTVNMALAMTLSYGTCTEVTDTTVTVTFRETSHSYPDHILKAKNKKDIETILSEIYGRPLLLACDKLAQETTKKEDAQPGLSNDVLMSHPMVEKALDMFNGKVMDIMKNQQ